MVGREGETGTPRCVVRRVGEPNSPVAGGRARAGEEAEVTGGLLGRVGEGTMACAAIETVARGTGDHEAALDELEELEREDIIATELPAAGTDMDATAAAGKTLTAAVFV